MTKLLSISQTVTALNGVISKSTIWRLCRDGDIPAVRLGRRWFIPNWWLQDVGSRPTIEETV